ncbi:MAG: SOS response-associated peptidase family protein [Verrucomicrobia bacterium]|nr:SOS response-associated peptidase family protein [Verrucomicrobiota bacterium]
MNNLQIKLLEGPDSLINFGLWEVWKKPGTEDWLRTCTIITCKPNDFMREIHTRMPVILPEEYFQGWLSGAMGKEILEPYPSDLMSAYPISTRGNSPANNDTGIVERVDAGLQIRRPDSADGLLL